VNLLSRLFVPDWKCALKRFLRQKWTNPNPSWQVVPASESLAASWMPYHRCACLYGFVLFLRSAAIGHIAAAISLAVALDRYRAGHIASAAISL
jgi:hypothetical protein